MGPRTTGSRQEVGTGAGGGAVREGPVEAVAAAAVTP